MSGLLKTILLVEDDLVLGETIQDLLENEYFKVTWVKDARQALESTFKSEYDLLLLDVNIPFINGFDLLKELRESGDLTPAIFLTAKVDMESLKKGFEVGADDYIKKPFEFDELLIRINSAIKKSFKSYSNTIVYRNLIYDIDQKQLFKEDKEINLTPSEQSLSEYFLKNIGKALTTED